MSAMLKDMLYFHEWLVGFSQTKHSVDFHFFISSYNVDAIEKS